MRNVSVYIGDIFIKFLIFSNFFSDISRYLTNQRYPQLSTYSMMSGDSNEAKNLGKVGYELTI